MAQYIYGRNTVLSALKQGKVRSLFLTHRFSFEPILKEAKQAKVPTTYVSEEELQKMVNGTHQGVVAEIISYSYASLEELLQRTKKKKMPFLLLLDGIEDPHNLGAILRSADAFGVDGIIVKKHGQVPLNATVAKVSTGAIDFVPVAQVTNLTTAIETLKKHGFWVVASDGSAKMDYRDVDYCCSIALVVGSEGFGISRLVLEHADFVTKIDMVGHVNSLNASVATAIYLSEVHYQRISSK